MRRIDKTKEQLMSELEEMRQRVAELEEADTQRRRAEEALRESEETLRALIENAPDAIFIHDLMGNFVDGNRKAEELIGYAKEELIGKNFFEAGLIPEARVLDVMAGLEQSRRGEIGKPCELELITKQGSRIYVEIAGLAIAGKENVQVLGFARDITERKRGEEVLRESEHKYKILFEGAIDGVSVIDAETMKVVLANQNAAKMYGFDSAEDAIGVNPLDFVHPDDRERVLRIIVEDMFEKDLRQVNEFRTITKDGKEKWISALGTAIEYEGKLAGLVSIRDITERKLVEQALQQSERNYRELAESITDVFFAMDEELRYTYWNRASEELTGISAKDALGKHLYDLFPDSEQTRRAEEVYLEALRTKQPQHFVNEYQLSGKDFFFEISAYPTESGLSVFVKDITERKRAEEEIERRAKRMEALLAVANVLSQTRDMDELLNEALAKVLDVMDTDVGGIYLLDLQSRVFRLGAQAGASDSTIASIGLIELEEEEIKRGLDWAEPVFEPERVFNEATVAKIEAAIENEGVRSHIIVPFWSKGIPVGAVVIADRRERHFTADDVDLLRAIGNEIAVGIENARLLERTRELSLTDELTRLYNRRHFWQILNTEMARTQRYGHSFSLVMLDIDGFKEYNDRFGHTNGDAVLQSLAQTLKSALRKSDLAFRYGGDEFTIILPATEGYRAKKIIDRIRSKWLQTPKLHYPTLESPLGFSAGIAQFPENAETADGLVFLVDAALYHAKRDGGYGVMLVSDLESLLAGVRSMATLDQVYALAATVDARDPYTYGHSNRVAAIAETIGKAMELSGKELSDLYAASLLHDIGKIGVPDLILIKPSGLVEDEWRIMKKHSAEGARISSYVREVRGSVPMILHHHEWYDGRGYPDGLMGEKIPLGARIISVADAYDTMTTPRLYRDITSHEEACEELRRCSETQFDPEVVEVFCRATSQDTILDG